MKKMYLVLLILFSIALCAITFALALEAGDPNSRSLGPRFTGPVMGPEPARPPEPPPEPIHCIRKTPLSKEQSDKLWLLAEESYSNTRDVRYALFQKQMQLTSFWADPKTSEGAILALQKEVDSERRKLDDLTTQYRLAQRKILSEAQLKELSEYAFEPGPGLNCRHASRAKR